jgi:hypothetical protein
MSTGGLSRARLARVHDVMAGYVERGEVPGLVTAISRRGELRVDAIGLAWASTQSAPTSPRCPGGSVGSGASAPLARRTQRRT